MILHSGLSRFEIMFSNRLYRYMTNGFDKRLWTLDRWREMRDMYNAVCDSMSNAKARRR